MTIWFSQFPKHLQARVTNEVQFGKFYESVDLLTQSQEEASLVQITNFEEIPSNLSGIENWYVPRGLGAYSQLLECLRKTGRPLFVSINGLGTQSITLLYSLMKEREWTWVFDARHIEKNAYLEQLTWLNAQQKPFAILSSQEEQLIIAAVMNPHSLIIPEDYVGNIELLLSLTSLSLYESPRPISQEEIDSVTGKETSLTVSRPLQTGDFIQKEDLAISPLSKRGLAPYLFDRVIGKIIQYSIEPGEALTFGHLRNELHED